MVIKETMKKDCVFCKVINNELPSHRIFENKNILVIMDIMPLNDGHLLVMPKTHYETILDIPVDLAGEIMMISKKMARHIQTVLHSEGISMLQNNFQAAGQVIPHFHMHLIPRNSNDGVRLFWSSKEVEPEHLSRLEERLKQVV